MPDRQKIVSIFAVFALVFGNAAGWLHVHKHAGGVCGCVETSFESESTHDESSACDSGCCVSPLRARWLSKRAVKAVECCESKAATSHGEHPGTPHQSDDCAICQHFMTCRENAMVLIVPVTVATSQPTASVSTDHQVIRYDFADSVHYLRGPPVV